MGDGLPSHHDPADERLADTESHLTDYKLWLQKQRTSSWKVHGYVSKRQYFQASPKRDKIHLECNLLLLEQSLLRRSWMNRDTDVMTWNCSIVMTTEHLCQSYVGGMEDVPNKSWGFYSDFENKISQGLCEVVLCVRVHLLRKVRVYNLPVTVEYVHKCYPICYCAVSAF